MRRSERKKRIFVNIAAVFLMIYIILPFIWLFISSISPKVELIATPPHWIPENPSFTNYLKLLGLQEASLSTGEIPPFNTAMRNSIVVALSSTGLSVLIGIFAAYAFARLEFRGKNAMLISVIALRMLPEIALVLPLYMIMQKLNMSDSKVFLTLVYMSFVLPFVIWILRSYFESIPVTLEEAALIDGANRWTIIWKIVFPLALPGIITTCIFCLLTCWDEFLFSLIFTTSYNAKTVTVAISEFTTRHMIDYGQMMAGGMLASLPPILFALVLQKYVVNGLTEGSVKE